MTAICDLRPAFAEAIRHARGELRAHAEAALLAFDQGDLHHAVYYLEWIAEELRDADERGTASKQQLRLIEVVTNLLDHRGLEAESLRLREERGLPEDLLEAKRRAHEREHARQLRRGAAARGRR